MPLWMQGGGAIDLRTWPEYDVDLLIQRLNLLERPCVIGIDLAWTTDLTALTCLFPPAEEEERWKALLFFWVPEERVPEIERRTKTPLSTWARQKFVTAIPGSAVDLREIEKKVKWAAEMFDVREVTFDPWGGMRQSAKNLIDEGLLCVEIRQGYATLSAPTKKFIELYMNQQLAHRNNPVLNWNASCLALLSDGADNVKPSKPSRDSASKRIDGVAAIITALTRAVTIEPASAPVVRWL